MTSRIIAETITDHYMESLKILHDSDNDSVTLVQRQGKPPEEIVKVIVLNLQEARCVADFIYAKLARVV